MSNIGQATPFNIFASTHDHEVTSTRKHHTPQQIYQLEESFAENPKPTEKERQEIAAVVNMEPEKVKFWFQNKRSQLKAKSERRANYELKVEHNTLKAENMLYKEALMKHKCSKCGGPFMNNSPLAQENIRLRNEIKKVQDLCLLLNPAAINMNTSLPQANPGPSFHLDVEQEYNFFDI